MTSRPTLLQFASVRELYLHFERIFLNGGGVSHQVTSICGQIITTFDHNFFHLVKLDDPDKPKPLLMANEKATILATTAGFGSYRYDRQRAVYLESAMLCLLAPDEVWEDPTLTSAKWIYIKHFDSHPYSCTILLVSERPAGPVPNTSFPGKNRDARKWRRGVRIYP
jgi:hypothetical protein